MAINAHKTGPGTLTIGATGSPTQWGGSVTKVAVTPKVDDGDSITVLDGSTEQDTGETTYTLDGSVYQSFDATSLLKKSWDDNGKTLPFTFVPNNQQAMKISGNLVMAPLAIGGDVTKRNTSDFSFKVVGTPVLAMTNTPPPAPAGN